MPKTVVIDDIALQEVRLVWSEEFDPVTNALTGNLILSQVDATYEYVSPSGRIGSSIQSLLPLPAGAVTKFNALRDAVVAKIKADEGI